MLDLNTTPAPEPLSLDTGAVSPLVSPEVAATRASKYQVAFQDVNIPTDWKYPDFYQSVLSGDEPNLRTHIAASLDAMRSPQLTQKLTDAIQTKQPPEVVNTLLDQAKKTQDPNSVLEEKYANWYLDKLNWPNPDDQDSTFWYDAMKDVPFRFTQGLGEKTMAYREFALKMKEDSDQEIQDLKQTWGGYGQLGWDYIKFGFQPYREFTERGQVKGVYNIGLGSNLQEQADRLYDLPFDQFKSELMRIKENLNPNPLLWSNFLDYVIGTGTSERKLDNLFTAGEAPTVLGALKGGVGVTKGIVLRNQVNRAFKTALKDLEAAKDIPPEVAAPAAAGDLKTAATENLNIKTENVLTNQVTPIKDGLEALPSGLRLDQAEGTKDPGNFGQGMVNHIEENGNTFVPKLMNALQNVLKVERIPDFLKVKQAIAAVKDQMKGIFKGFTVLDVGDPVWEPTTNTYHIPFHLGDESTGAYFNTVNQAYNYADLRGFALAREPLLRQVNKQFYDQSTKLTKQINAVKEELRSTPIKQDAAGTYLSDAERARFESLPNQLKELQGKFDDLLAWHADKLTEPGIGDIMINRGLGATIEQQGRGFYIKYTKPLNETENLIRDAMLKTKESQAPRSIMKDFVGWLRTPEETQAFNERLNRKVASYSANVLSKVLNEEASSIRQLYRGVITRDPLTGEKIPFLQNRLQAIVEKNFSKAAGKRWADWERTVDLGRYLVDPDTGKTGYWYKTPAEFERFFERVNGYLPDQLQVTSYLSFKKVYEADRMMRNILLYRGASRVGAETHSLWGLSKEGERVFSDKFAGVLRGSLPGTTDNIFIMERELGQGAIEKGGTIAPTRLKKLQAEIEQGIRKVVEIYNPELRPLKGYDNVGNERIRYIITGPGHNVEPLQLDILPRRGGGHVVYDYDHYIKQAIVRPEKIKNTLRHWYEGDTTIMPMTNRAMAQKIAGHLDQVRKYLLDKDEVSAKQHAIAHLPMDWSEVRKWFLGGKNIDGSNIEPRLGLQEPITVVPRGKTISQVDNTMRNRYNYYKRGINKNILANSFEDGTKQGSLARQYQVDFTSERDADTLYTIHDDGWHGNPLYRYEPAKLVDVMPTLNRAINAISHSMFMDDYKIFAVERWIREAAPHLNLKDPEPELRSSPFYHFYNHEYLSGTSMQDMSHLAQQHYKIKSFLGEKSWTDRTLEQLSQRIDDAVYNSLGGKGLAKGGWLPGYAVKNILEPFKLLRNLAFHSAIGLGSLPQLIAQSMTYAAIMGISGPSRAGPGTMGAILHQMARLTPWATRMAVKEEDLINMFDHIASHPSFEIPGMVHFKPGQFAEAYRALKNTGFDIVGHEHTMLERLYTPKAVSNGVQNFLDASGIIFKGSERNARFGSWYTSYLEFREKNPTGALSNKDIQEILERADTLSGNMSRASRSLLQNGVLSFPMQFLGYQLRLAELFTGTRLAETSAKAAMVRARWLLTFGALFGFPTAAGVGGFPAGDMMRKYAIENGYVVGDNFIKDLGMNGIPAVAISWITGGGDYSKGTTYNIGQRYGAPGFDMIRDALVSDKPFMQIAQGAGGTLLANTWNQGGPVRRFMWDVLTGEQNTYPLRPEDLILPITSNVASLSKADQVIQAINSGNWISRNQQLLQQDVSWQKALFMGVTGLQDQNVADAYIKSLALKSREANEQFVRTEFFKEFHSYLFALKDNNPQQAEDYARRAQSVLVRYAYPMEKRDQLMALASRGFEDLVNRLDQQFYTRNVPTESPLYSKIMEPQKSYQQILLEAYQKTLQLQQQKKQ